MVVAEGARRGGSRSTTPTTNEEHKVEETDISIEEQADGRGGVHPGPGRGLRRGRLVAMRIDDDTILVDVTGPDLGLLVGQKGLTLQSIEELVRTVVQRQTEGRGARINVDVAGYRAKRREALERFAQDLADEGAGVGDGARPRADERRRPQGRPRHHRPPRRVDHAVGRRGAPPPRGGASRLTGSTRGLDEILDEARSLGFLGPGPVAPQLAHAGPSPG